MVRKNPNADNPLKREGQSKETTRRKADEALEPTAKRRKVDDTETQQGGSHKGGGKADSRHPSQHGGVKDEMDDRRPQR